MLNKLDKNKEPMANEDSPTKNLSVCEHAIYNICINFNLVKFVGVRSRISDNKYGDKLHKTVHIERHTSQTSYQLGCTLMGTSFKPLVFISLFLNNFISIICSQLHISFIISLTFSLFDNLFSFPLRYFIIFISSIIPTSRVDSLS